MSRPNSTNPKQHRITVRLTQADLDRLIQEAARAGINPSQVIRNLIREHALDDDTQPISVDKGDK
jgi:predicted DNA binding CopG/RHH family protein